jgi:methionyl-tRNA formyltransferase
VRSVLVGAVESSLVTLEALGRHGIPPAAVFTLPHSHAHRHSDYVDLRPLAARMGVSVIETTNANSPETRDHIRGLEPALAFVVGWSQICGPEFLMTPRCGSIGYHPAPLPENRGRAVIPWTVLQGRSDTAGTLFWMDEGLDSGDILLQERFPVAADETARTLYQKQVRALSAMLDEALPLLRNGTAPRTPQDHARATYCAKRTAEDGLIDWSASARQVWTLIRAVGDPYPGAFTYHRRRRMVIWAAEYVGDGPYTGLPGQVQALLDSGALVQCGDGKHVLLRTVQREQEERRPAADVLKNHERLGIDWVRLLRHVGWESGG